jgi:hypothetical protein
MSSKEKAVQKKDIDKAGAGGVSHKLLKRNSKVLFYNIRYWYQSLVNSIQSCITLSEETDTSNGGCWMQIHNFSPSFRLCSPCRCDLGGEMMAD